MSEEQRSEDRVTVLPPHAYDAMVYDEADEAPTEALRAASERAREVVRKQQIDLSVHDATGYVAVTNTSSSGCDTSSSGADCSF